MRADAAAYIRECDLYQRQAPISRVSAQDLTTITSPWTFTQWGINIVRSLPTSPTQKKVIIGCHRLFNKWIKVEAFTSIKDKEVIQFVLKNIVCRFRIAQSIVTDNGPQFDNRVFRNFCRELKIKNLYSTPRYP